MPQRTLTQAQILEMLEAVREDGQCGITRCGACTGIGAPCSSNDDLDSGPEYRRLKIAYFEGLLDPDYVAQKRAEEDARYAREPL